MKHHDDIHGTYLLSSLLSKAFTLHRATIKERERLISPLKFTRVGTRPDATCGFHCFSQIFFYLFVTVPSQLGRKECDMDVSWKVKVREREFNNKMNGMKIIVTAL